jgi:hypothetical protein
MKLLSYDYCLKELTGSVTGSIAACIDIGNLIARSLNVISMPVQSN